MTKIFTMANAVLGWRSQLSFAGAICEFATNSEDLLTTLASWRSTESTDHHAQFTMDIIVSDGSAPARTPHFRGLHHVVIASFGESDIFVFDLLRRKVSGMVSKKVARDTRFWDATILPLTIGVLGATVGILPVHCACLSINGDGLLIAGFSGTGKSTLSIALAQCGLDFVSDDWTYVSYRQHKLSAHGMSAPVKLLPDAIRHFPALEGLPLRHALNGELAYEVNAEQDMGVNAIRCCEPRWIVFPERSADAPSGTLVSVPTTQTRAYLESSVEVLPSQLAEAVRERTALMWRLAALPCWKFRYWGTPQYAAQELLRLFAEALGLAA